ncbi:hypothetical protein ACFVR2_22550 [Gottfriedia sp. NPDC057991]|uniref:hypothetical protein n=1 Tax=Gottfriedia sp. NPDC057991 TaxID=3346298 RepID=UPI0036DADA3E
MIFGDGAEGVATYITYKNILSLKEKNKATGEYLSGKYFWASDMILIDDISCETITDVVVQLLKDNEFWSVFEKS